MHAVGMRQDSAQREPRGRRAKYFLRALLPSKTPNPKPLNPINPKPGRPRRTDTAETWASDTPVDDEEPAHEDAPTGKGFVFPGNPNSVIWHAI